VNRRLQSVAAGDGAVFGGGAEVGCVVGVPGEALGSDCTVGGGWDVGGFGCVEEPVCAVGGDGECSAAGTVDIVGG